MIPSLREVLALPVVTAGGPRVVSGADHLDGPVRWVHISELTDLTDRLEGGELVLTTGLPLTGDAEETARYIRMLAELRVAGLFVELGTRIAHLPEHLGPLAESLGLPLVVLATEIRFVEVTQQVHRLIIADRYGELEFARTAHEVFTSLNIARASMTDIVTRAAQLLGAPLVLEDRNHRVLASCSADRSPTQLLQQWPERSRRELRGAGEEQWTAVPVGFGDDRWGRLVLPGEATRPAPGRHPGDQPATARARMVLERAAQSLQLHRMLQREQDALLLQALGGLLDDLAEGRVTDASEALARAGALGLQPGARYVPLVVRMPERTDAHHTEALGQGDADRRLLASVRGAVAARGNTALVSLRRAGTVVLVLATPTADAVDTRLEALCADLQEQLTGRGCGEARWVAGTAASDADLLVAAHGLRAAEHVAEVALSLPTTGRRLHRSTDTRLRGVLALLRSDHRVQAFAEAEIGALLEHDARTGHRTLDLLRTYLECSGSKTRTAERTGLSRPTLYSRLRTLERLLGVSLDSAESRTSLHAALMVVDTAQALDTSNSVSTGGT